MKNMNIIIITALIATSSVHCFNIKSGTKLSTPATTTQAPKTKAAPTAPAKAQPKIGAKVEAKVGNKAAPAKAAAVSEASILADLKKAYDATLSHAVNAETFTPWTHAVTQAVTFITSNADGNANLPKIGQALEISSNSLVKGKGAPSASVKAAVKKITDSLAQIKPSTSKQTSAARVAKQLADYLRIAAA